jgi:hypothetical protein
MLLYQLSLIVFKIDNIFYEFSLSRCSLFRTVGPFLQLSRHFCSFLSYLLPFPARI